MSCIQNIIYCTNYICVPLIPYAYKPKHNVRFYNKLPIKSTYEHKMLR